MVKRATQDAVVADEPSGLRARILAAASSLMAKHGVAALTTRSVATAAGVQPPALYRLFGDKRGLLHAVAEYDLLAVMADWQETVPDPASDPVSDLAHGWDFSVAFGLANPAVFAIVNELGVQRSSAAIAGLSAMRGQVEKVACAGRLCIPVMRAVELIHSAGIGTIAALLAVPVAERDPSLAPAMRDAVMAAILTDPAAARTDDGVPALAVTLGAKLNDIDGITPGERLLLSELLNRLALGKCV